MGENGQPSRTKVQDETQQGRHRKSGKRRCKKSWKNSA